MVTFSGGTGTEKDPYIIKDGVYTAIQQMALIADSSYVSGGYYYKIKQDIDYSGQTWTVIGSTSVPFRGTIDGFGHTISNVTYTGEILFIGSDTDAYMKNISFNTVSITYTNNSYIIRNFALVERCSFISCTLITETNNGSGKQSHLINGGNTILNCYAIGCYLKAKDTQIPWHYNHQAGTFISSCVTNCYVDNCTIISQGCGGDRAGAGGFYTYYYSCPNVTFTNCVGLNNTISSTGISAKISRTGVYSGSNTTKINCYAVNGGSSTTGNDGLAITSTNYENPSWWENTAQFNFDDVWEWDDELKRPKLIIPKSASVYLKTNNAWVQGDPYIKVNNQWIQGEQVFIKVNDVWQLQI